MNYEQMVKALTCGNDGKLPCHNNECPYWVDQWHGIGLCNVIKKDADAAAAIEHSIRLHWQAEALIEASEDTIKELQDEVERLKVDLDAAWALMEAKDD